MLTFKMDGLQERGSTTPNKNRTSFFIDDILLSKPRKSTLSPPSKKEPYPVSRSDSPRESARERFTPSSASAMLTSLPSAHRMSPPASLSCSPPAVHTSLAAGIAPHLLSSLTPMIAASSSGGPGSGLGAEFAANYAAYLPGGSVGYLGHQPFAHPALQAAACAAAAAMAHPKHLDHPFLMPSTHGE